MSEAKNEPPWFTEGYIGEAKINLTSTDQPTITIDPVTPFKVEHHDEKFILFASGGFLYYEESVEKVVDSQKSRDTKTQESEKANYPKAMFVPVSNDFHLCGKIFCDAPLMITELKTRHQKARFGMNKNFKIISITLI